MVISNDSAAERPSRGSTGSDAETLPSAVSAAASSPAPAAPDAHPVRMAGLRRDGAQDGSASRGDQPPAQKQDGNTDQKAGIHFDQLRKVRPKELLTRFAFGAGASVLAAIVTLVAGYKVGGIFLAFPAILLASLTLITKESGPQEAGETARGGVLGSLALVAFAATVWQGLRFLPVLVVLPLALGAWLLVALSLYALHRWWGSRASQRHRKGAP